MSETSKSQTTGTESHSMGDLRAAAHRAIDAGEVTVIVDAKALLALCESELWAHRQMMRLICACW
jgi:hypothetical protein